MYSLGFIAKWECLRAERSAGNLLFFVASSQISLTFAQKRDGREGLWHVQSDVNAGFLCES